MDEWLKYFGDYLPYVVASTGVVIAALVYRHRIITSRWAAKRARLSITEQNLDVLQRLNETALFSRENLQAVVKSANSRDEISDHDARVFYFHFLRINRLMRVYEYCRQGLIDETERDRIIDPHVPALHEILPVFEGLRGRGYPEDFERFIREKIERSIEEGRQVTPLSQVLLEAHAVSKNEN